MRGIVFNGETAEIRTDVEVRDPGPNEVWVRVAAAGVCHSDVSVINGTIPWPAPSLMGHEGAGVVERVGAEAVYRFRGECDEAAAANDGGGFIDDRRGGMCRIDGADGGGMRGPDHRPEIVDYSEIVMPVSDLCIILLIFTPKEQHR